ncbi:hypothetical protein WDV93_09550 [Pantoea ananatis]
MQLTSCALIAHSLPWGQLFSGSTVCFRILLHYQHPLMPGYLEGSVPHGINVFTPDENQLQLLAELTGKQELSWSKPLKVNCPSLASTQWAAPLPLGKTACPI